VAEGGVNMKREHKIIVDAKKWGWIEKEGLLCPPPTSKWFKDDKNTYIRIHDYDKILYAHQSILDKFDRRFGGNDPFENLLGRYGMIDNHPLLCAK
jgi:hypothetical protein